MINTGSCLHAVYVIDIKTQLTFTTLTLTLTRKVNSIYFLELVYRIQYITRDLEKHVMVLYSPYPCRPTLYTYIKRYTLPYKRVTGKVVI